MKHLFAIALVVAWTPVAHATDPIEVVRRGAFRQYCAALARKHTDGMVYSLKEVAIGLNHHHKERMHSAGMDLRTERGLSFTEAEAERCIKTFIEPRTREDRIEPARPMGMSTICLSDSC